MLADSHDLLLLGVGVLIGLVGLGMIGLFILMRNPYQPSATPTYVEMPQSVRRQ